MCLWWRVLFSHSQPPLTPDPLAQVFRRRDFPVAASMLRPAAVRWTITV